MTLLKGPRGPVRVWRHIWRTTAVKCDYYVLGGCTVYSGRIREREPQPEWKSEEVFIAK